MQRDRTIAALTAVAFLGYLAFAWWLRDGLHYIIGDSLARTADAVYTVSGRDPHLGAIGFYWPPLPSLLQIPLIPLLSVVHAAEWAGPVVSAAAMALTIPVIARLCAAYGTDRRFMLAAVVAFAANPMVVFFAANGMGEAVFFLGTALALLGFARWARRGEAADLALLAFGLTAGVLVRFEALGLAVVLAAAAAARRTRPWLSSRVAAAVLLPPVFAFAVWMLVQRILLGDALYFLHAYTGNDTSNLFWLPDPHGNPLVALAWAAGWVVVMSPVLLLVPVALRERGRSLADVRHAVALLGCAAMFPVLEAVLLLRHQTTGNPRYFMLLLLFGVAAGAWMAARSRAWTAAVAVLLAVAAVSTTVKLTDPRATRSETENAVFDRLLRRPAPVPESTREWQTWRAVTRLVDPLLTGRRLALADTNYAFPAVLFTAKRSHFLIPSDRAWERTVADPAGRIDVVLVPSPAYLRTKNSLSPFAKVPEDVLAAEPGAFSKVADFGIVSVWARS